MSRNAKQFVSAQAEAGNVKLVRGLWNDEFLRVLENFPAARHDDEVDALSGAYEYVGRGGGKFCFETIPRPRLLAGMDAALGGGRERWSSGRGARRRARTLE
jgi:hypothetical protein